MRRETVPGQPDSSRSLVLNAVRRYVAEAIRTGSLISAAECASEILKAHPGCGLDEETIADEIMMAAAKAGVPIEIGGGGRHKRRTAA
jgi:hypothetical protein